MAGGLDVAFDFQAPVADRGRERQRPHDPGALYSGQRPDAVQERPIQGDDVARLLVARLGRPELKRQDVLRLEAQVHVHEGMEGAEHQAGAQQHHHGQRHLRAGERTPKALPPQTRRGALRSVAQGLGEVEPQHPHGRGQAEEERRQDRERGGKDQHPGLDCNRRERGQPG